jgi:hypothetical protein
MRSVFTTSASVPPAEAVPAATRAAVAKHAGHIGCSFHRWYQRYSRFKSVRPQDEFGAGGPTFALIFLKEDGRGCRTRNERLDCTRRRNGKRNKRVEIALAG